MSDKRNEIVLFETEDRSLSFLVEINDETLMIAESQPDEKELMISVVMNCIGFLEYGWKDKW